MTELCREDNSPKRDLYKTSESLRADMPGRNERSFIG